MQELDVIDNFIKEHLIRLQTLKVSMEAIEKEVQRLGFIEDQLCQNLRFLKQRQVITLAFEYKKTKEDLAKVRRQLAMVNNDGITASKAYNQISKIIEDAKEQYNKVLEKAGNNILHVDFGVKHGQE